MPLIGCMLFNVKKICGVFCAAPCMGATLAPAPMELIPNGSLIAHSPSSCGAHPRVRGRNLRGWDATCGDGN